MTPTTAHDAVDFFYRAALRAQARHSEMKGEYTLLLYGGEPCLNSAALVAALRRARSLRNIGFNLVTRPAGGYNSTDYYREATKLLLQAFRRFRDEGIFEDRIMCKVRACAEAKPYPFDCAACGGAQVVVAPDGQVGICHALLGKRETFVGTMNDPGFFPEDHPVWAEWSRRSPLNMPECKDCWCLGICGRGCPVNGSSGIWGMDKGFCIHAQTILEWLIWDVYQHELQLSQSTAVV
jgi:uncharacterized protein